MYSHHVRRGELRGTAVSPAHRPIPQAARSCGRDRSETGSNPSPLVGRPLQRRDTHCLGHRVIALPAVSSAKAGHPLPDPSLGTIAPEARELIVTARSRAPANTAAASEWPCTRPNSARNPSSSAGDGPRWIPEIADGGIAREQFIRIWVAARKLFRSSNRSCLSVPASSLPEFAWMSRCWGPAMPC